MKRRTAIVVAVVSLLLLAIHLVLVRSMAHGHVAHVLLGSGNAAPPFGAAVLAISLVVVRVAAVVLVPGLLLAALASIVAHALVGPPRGGGYREGDGGGAGVTGSSSGAGTSSDDDGSGAVTGLSMEGRGT